MTVMNPLMGRYGYLIGGQVGAVSPTTRIRLTRETLKRDMVDIIDQYKDVEGVLMFAFGNESNYGLSWSSFEIENLPEGEQNTAKARYLYSLYAEVIAKRAGKLRPNHLFTIVNGDIQYIDLIAEYLPGHGHSRQQRLPRESFTTCGIESRRELDMPVVFFEFGSDAFNARTFQEDQLNQALILKEQWQEMYNKAGWQGRGRQCDRWLHLRMARRVVEVPADREPGYPGHQRLLVEPGLSCSTGPKGRTT